MADDQNVTNGHTGNSSSGAGPLVDPGCLTSPLAAFGFLAAPHACQMHPKFNLSWVNTGRWPRPHLLGRHTALPSQLLEGTEGDLGLSTALPRFTPIPEGCLPARARMLSGEAFPLWPASLSVPRCPGTGADGQVRPMETFLRTLATTVPTQSKSGRLSPCLPWAVVSAGQHLSTPSFLYGS